MIKMKLEVSKLKLSSEWEPAHASCKEDALFVFSVWPADYRRNKKQDGSDT